MTDVEMRRLRTLESIIYGMTDSLYASYCLALNIERKYNLSLPTLAQEIAQLHKHSFA